MARTLVGWTDAHYVLDSKTNRAMPNAALDVQVLETGEPFTDLQAPSGFAGQPFPTGQARSDESGFYGFTVPEETPPLRVRVAATATEPAGQWLTPVGQALANGPLLGKGEASNTFLPQQDRGQAFMAKVDTGIGNTCLALLGDSTGNAPDEWFRLAVGDLAAAHPSMRVLYRLWNDAAQSYDAAEEIQPGASPDTGVLVHDTFARTAAELIGSAPDVGGAWGGPSSALGDWGVDGTSAVRTSDAVVAEVVSDSGAVGDHALTANLTLSSVGGTASRQFRLFAKYLDSANQVCLQITVQTSGTVTWNVFKRIGGVVTNVVNGFSNPFPGSTAASTFDVALSVVGTEVTATVNGNTITGTLTASDAAALAQSSYVGFSGGTTGDKVNEITLDVTASETSVQTLTAYNGSFPGSTLAYQEARLAAMLPEEPDLVLLSSCHNYGPTTGAEYVGIVEDFIDQVRGMYPGVGVAVSSQNPQKPPATNRVSHANRLLALRPAALVKGWGYIPAFEAFVSRSDRGISLVQADGVHPTVGAGGGSEVWADAATAYLDGLSLTPA